MRQIGIPQPHISPSLESLRLCPATRWKQRNHHARSHALPRRYIRLKLDRWKVPHNPLVLTPADLWGIIGVIHPYRPILPARRQLQCIPRFADWNVFLGVPIHLENIRTVLLLNFVAYNVTGVGSRNPHILDAKVSCQCPVFDIRRGGLNRLFIFYLVVFPRRRNAPAAHSCNLRLRIKIRLHQAIPPAVWPQDFECASPQILDFTVRLYGCNILGINQDSIRLFVMRRQRRRGCRVHPCGCVRLRTGHERAVKHR